VWNATDESAGTAGNAERQPAAPSNEVSTILLIGAALRIAHGLRSAVAGWCIGHAAPVPCAHWQLSSPDSHSSAGVTASVAIRAISQTAATTPITRRSLLTKTHHSDLNAKLSISPHQDFVSSNVVERDGQMHKRIGMRCGYSFGIVGLPTSGRPGRSIPWAAEDAVSRVGHL
jgi:hypothetical protein